jgi:hypothetical protein
MLLRLVRLVVPIVNNNEQHDISPVRRSLTRRLFSTLIVSDDDSGYVVQNVVTLVTHAAMDPLMRPVLQRPPLSITPSCVETPPVESYTHVSMLVFIVLFHYIWNLMSCWFFCCNDTCPLIPEEFIPKQDMQFDDLDDAYDYYYNYAKMAGFDVRKGRKSPHVQ